MRRATDSPSVFRCPACGACTHSVTVPYDEFGYAVCPRCGHGTRPSDNSVRDDEAVWAGDARGTRND